MFPKVCARLLGKSLMAVSHIRLSFFDILGQRIQAAHHLLRAFDSCCQQKPDFLVQPPAIGSRSPFKPLDGGVVQVLDDDFSHGYPHGPLVFLNVLGPPYLPFTTISSPASSTWRTSQASLLSSRIIFKCVSLVK